MVLHFHMENCFPLSVLNFVGTKSLVEKCTTTPTKMEDMDFVPYASAISNLMYYMVYTKPDIAQPV
jgi:hypothetical protein